MLSQWSSTIQKIKKNARICVLLYWFLLSIFCFCLKKKFKVFMEVREIIPTSVLFNSNPTPLLIFPITFPIFCFRTLPLVLNPALKQYSTYFTLKLLIVAWLQNPTFHTKNDYFYLLLETLKNVGLRPS